jgi:putative oxidoreductase
MIATASLVLRIVVGSIFLAQGVRKLFGKRDAPFGRGGLTAMIEAKRLPSPPLLALLASIVEFSGGILLLSGLLTRLALIPLMTILLMAVLVFKRSDGFYGGWDWPYSVLGSSVALFILGPGRYSLDSLFMMPSVIWRPFGHI